MHISVHGVVVVLVLFGIESAQVDEPGANALHEPAPRIQNRQVPGAVQLFEQVCVSLVQSNQMKRVGWEGRRSEGEVVDAATAGRGLRWFTGVRASAWEECVP